MFWDKLQDRFIVIYHPKRLTFLRNTLSVAVLLAWIAALFL
ncbi:MAG: hypothetical protein ACI4RT_00620 [Candidatus Spyradenecus sp.]